MTSRLSWDSLREKFKDVAVARGEWQGFPFPVEGFDLVLEDRYPSDRADAIRRSEREEAERLARANPTDLWARVHTCRDEDVGPVLVRNTWTSRSRNLKVTLIQQDGGRVELVKEPLPPDGAMRRLDLWLSTLGASDAWDVKAEMKARDKLATLINDRQQRHLDLLGCFLETSPRSRVTYLFRRGRPTVAMKGGRLRNGTEYMGCLAVLCLHPIGLYWHREQGWDGGGTWAGVMVPSDDLIAHLLWMRGDERGFWARANHHDPAWPSAGL